MSLQLQSCNCIGPQNGQPLCPCMMRGVTQVDGRYIKTQDLGPVVPAPSIKDRSICACCGQKLGLKFFTVKTIGGDENYCSTCCLTS